MLRVLWRSGARRTLRGKRGGCFLMGNGFWRTDKRSELFSPGRCATQRVNEYEKTWRSRCYAGGIPDEVPKKVCASGRAPSWKSVAIAILQNDLHFYSLGFSRPSYEKQLETLRLGQLAVSGVSSIAIQMELFPGKATR